MVSNSASLPDVPIVARAFAWAMVRGLLDYYVETEAGGVEMLVCWGLRRTFSMNVRARSCRWCCRLTPSGALIAHERS